MQFYEILDPQKSLHFYSTTVSNHFDCNCIFKLAVIKHLIRNHGRGPQGLDPAELFSYVQFQFQQPQISTHLDLDGGIHHYIIFHN